MLRILFLFIGHLALGASLLAVAGTKEVLAAEDYPDRPIRVIIPGAAGGGAEGMLRLLADKLNPRLGQTIVIEARPGGNGILGLNFVAQSKPDGYTLAILPSTMIANPLFFKSFTLDTVNGLDPIIEVASFPFFIMAGSARKFKTFREMVTYAKSNPGMVKFGHGAAEMDVTLLVNSLGIKVNVIPYSGSGMLPQALLGDVIDVALISLPSIRGAVASGKVHPLTVLFSKRSSVSPDTPSIIEEYPQAEIVPISQGISGPKGLPRKVVDKLNSEINVVLKDPDFAARLREVLAAEVRGGTPENWKTAAESIFEKYKRGAQIMKRQPQ